MHSLRAFVLAKLFSIAELERASLHGDPSRSIGHATPQYASLETRTDADSRLERTTAWMPRPLTVARVEANAARRCPNPFQLSSLQVLRLTAALLLILVFARVAVAQSAQPDGAGLERGTLPESWAETGEGCGTQPDFRLHEYNADLYILRQSGCTNYEKPFLYLIFGNGQALLLDSGAKNANVAGAVQAALARWAATHGGHVPRLVVAHSHGHGDHIAGDAQLAALPNVTVIGTAPDAVQTFFGLRDWPNAPATYDLGGRILDIVPIPGHERASIAVYDRRTGVLLTGDTMYPGRLYVADPAAFTASVSRLVAFTAGKPIAHVLGAHIEQARTPFLDYLIGTKFQPDEHGLELSRGQLLELNDALAQMGGTVVRRAMRDFTVWPITR
jgi:hydroxyacylglutathione hydrolase